MRTFPVLVGVLSIAVAAGLSSGATAQDEAPCTTKAECDYRAEVRDMRARQAEWARRTKEQDDWAMERARISAQARADANNGRISRAQDIMHRRHAAAAAAAAGNK